MAARCAIDPMTEFVLRLDLANHVHHHAAQHAFVHQMLGVAGQAIRANSDRRGDLTIRHFNASEGVNRPVTIGSWAFTETETRNPEAEA
jgi:hypothetical protein